MRSLRRERRAAMTAVAAFQTLADFCGRCAPACVLRDIFQLRDGEAAAFAADDIDRHAAFSQVAERPWMSRLLRGHTLVCEE